MTPACAVCGAAHATCGAGRAPVNVVDLTPASRRTAVAELAMYEVEYPSMTTRQKLSEEDAKVFGDRAKRVGDVKQLSPVEVSRPSYADESSDVESVPPGWSQGDGENPPAPVNEPAEKKAPEPKNKARTSSAK